MQIVIRISIYKFYDVNIIVLNKRQKLQERKSKNSSEINFILLLFKIT
jgi:hypothetical protein